MESIQNIYCSMTAHCLASANYISMLEEWKHLSRLLILGNQYNCIKQKKYKQTLEYLQKFEMFSFFRSLEHDAFLSMFTYLVIMNVYSTRFVHRKRFFLIQDSNCLIKINKKIKISSPEGKPLSDLELGWSQPHSKGRLFSVIFTPTSHYSFLSLSLLPYRLSLFQNLLLLFPTLIILLLKIPVKPLFMQPLLITLGAVLDFLCFYSEF